MKKSALIIFSIVLLALLAGLVCLFLLFGGNDSSDPSAPNQPGISAPQPVEKDEYLPMCISVTFGEDVNSTKNFCWQTFDEYTNGALQYVEISQEKGTDGFADIKDFSQIPTEKIVTVNSTAEETALMLPASESELKNPMLQEHKGLVHRVWLSELNAGAKYLYRVGDTAENKWSSVATFSVPTKDDKTSFIYTTDAQGFVQDDYNVWGNLISNACEMFPNSEFILNLGDTVEEDTNQNQWRMFFETPYDILRNNTFVSVAGNKDKKSTMLHFTFGDNDNRTARVSGYYSFDYENIHFAVLNTGDNEKDLKNSQVEWLKNDMSKSQAKWKIVLLHKAPVTNANHYNDMEITALRLQLLPVFDELNIDIAIMGHDHYFFRSEPMTAIGVGKYSQADITIDGDEVKMLSDMENGTVYFMNGSAGTKQHSGKTYSIDGVYPDESFLTELASFTYCTATENEIVFKTYTVDENGISMLIDAWGIRK